MRSSQKRIVVLSDIPQSEGLLRLFSQFENVKLEITASLAELSHMVNNVAPDCVLIFSDKEQPGRLEVLKNLRSNEGMDQVPILVFPELPTAEAIMSLLK
jgi:DNA-binding response OmpR family regulator